MLEREQPRDARYDKDELVDYTTTLPGSVEAWTKAGEYLKAFLSDPPDEFFDETYIFYINEPKGLCFNFPLGILTEVNIEADKDGRLNLPGSGMHAIFPRDKGDQNRLEMIEIVQRSIENMLAQDPPKVHIRTN